MKRAAGCNERVELPRPKCNVTKIKMRKSESKLRLKHCQWFDAVKLAQAYLVHTFVVHTLIIITVALNGFCVN